VEVGDRALATALGVDYGSFTIEPLDAEAVARETEVTPEPSELLAQTIRMRCAMKRCLEGLDVARVARLTFDEDMVHWVRTLEGAPRAVLDQLLAGFSPRLLAHMAGFAPGDIARSIECALERGFVVAVRDELADLTVGKPVALLPPAKEDHTAPSPPVRFDEDSAPPKPEPESEVHLVGATLSLEDEPRGERAHSRRTDVSAAQPWFREEPRQLTPPPVPLATGAPASPQRLELPAPAPVGRTRGRPAPSGPSDGAANPRVPGDELAPPEPSPPLPEIPLPGVPRSDPFLATSVTAAPPPPARRARLRTAALLLVAASVVGGAARFAVSPGSPHPPAAAAAPPPSAVRSSSPSAPSLPPHGLLEVTAPEAMAIVVDGTERGHGPKLSVTLGEGMHELLTDTNGGAAAGAKKRFIEIARGRVTHVDLTLAAPPASPPK
jgi:hypothetical protein